MGKHVEILRRELELIEMEFASSPYRAAQLYI